MRVMLLVMDERRAILDWLYESIANALPECRIFRLTSEQQENLARFFKDNDPADYDRVVIFSRLKRLIGQERLLRLVSGLVFFEYDVWQNYMPECDYHGRYSRFYLGVPGCRVISSGHQVAERLRSEGIDARFVPKGFDDRAITDTGGERDIFAAFLGSTKNEFYARRRAMLGAIGDAFPLLVTRTESGDDYVATLNRIRVFVNADSGMSEYMLKNFEALAAGCVLLTEDQGARENEVIGFRDMENVVFYRSAAEAVEKLRMLETSPELCARLSEEGKRFVRERFAFSRIGPLVAREIVAPMPAPRRPGLFDYLVARIRYRWMLARSRPR